MTNYYGIFSHYGNQTSGADSLHVFENKADRDAWNQDDPENKKSTATASHKLAREFNKTYEKSHGFHCTYHYADGRESILDRDNGRQHEEFYV